MAEPNVEELVKKRDVAGLIKALKYEPMGKLFTEDIRRKAARALGGLGDQRAIRPLCRRFGDDLVSGFAVEAIVAILNQLSEEDYRKNIKSLIKAFEESIDREEEKGLAKVLAMVGKPAAESLVEYCAYLTDQRPSIEHKGEQAALALGKMGDTRAVKPLMRIVNNKFSSNSELAAELLGKIGDPQAVKTLSRAMRSGTADDYITCTSIAEALEKMGTSGLEALTQTLHSRHKWAPLCAAKVLENVELQQRVPMTDRDHRKFEELIDELEVGRQKFFEELG